MPAPSLQSSAKRKKNAARHSESKSKHHKHEHPDHTVHLNRLHRVRGQLEGIQVMIHDRRYCPDIINQLKAARAGIAALEAEIFKSHLRACVRDAFSGSDSFQAEAKVDEIMKMVF